MTATHMTMPSAPRDPLPHIHGIRGCWSTCPYWKDITLQLRSSSPRCCVYLTHIPPQAHRPSSDTRNKRGRVSLSVTASYPGSCHSPIPRDFPTSDQNPHCVTKASHRAVKIAEFLCSLHLPPLGALPMHRFCPTDSPVAREGGGDQA